MHATAYRGSEPTVHGITRNEVKELADNWGARADAHAARGEDSAERIARGVSDFLYLEAIEAAPKPNDPGIRRFVNACLGAIILALVVACTIRGAVEFMAAML